MGTEPVNSSQWVGLLYFNSSATNIVCYTVPEMKRWESIAKCRDAQHTQFPELFEPPSKSHYFIPTQREVLSPASHFLFNIFC